MAAHQYCDVNCGGTDCDAPVRVTATTPSCNHGTGWWVDVKFWIFTRRAFVCSECGHTTKGVNHDTD